jgi:hypothetical protein
MVARDGTVALITPRAQSCHRGLIPGIFANKSSAAGWLAAPKAINDPAAHYYGE